MPPIGFGLGVAAVFRGAKVKSKHGALIIALSIVGALAWAVVIASGALTATNSDF
jgi:hypothetical protein